MQPLKARAGLAARYRVSCFAWRLVPISGRAPHTLLHRSPFLLSYIAYLPVTASRASPYILRKFFKWQMLSSLLKINIAPSYVTTTIISFDSYDADI